MTHVPHWIRLTWDLLGPCIGAIAAVALLWVLGLLDLGPEPPRYSDVVVDSVTIVQGEPDADVGFVESLARPRVEPVQRAAAPDAAAGDIAAFCRAAGYRLATTTIDRSAPGPRPPGNAGGAPPGDALPSPAPELAQPAAEPSTPPSGLPPALQLPPVALGARSGIVGRRESEYWLPLSDGSLVRETYDVRPPYRWRVDGDSLVLQRSRWALLADLAPLALCAGGAWGSIEADSWVPATVGCGLGVAITVR